MARLADVGSVSASKAATVKTKSIGPRNAAATMKINTGTKTGRN
jgi:hypothetical protein